MSPVGPESGPESEPTSEAVGPAARAVITGRPLHPGSGSGTVMRLDEPLSLWGGSDRDTGVIIDEHHPQCGASLAGRVVVMTTGRGSSSSSSVLAEQLRQVVAPAALLLTEPDAVLVLGAMVAAELYDTRMPIVLLSRADHDALAEGTAVAVTAVEASSGIEGVGDTAGSAHVDVVG